MMDRKVATPDEMSELGRETACSADAGDVFGLIGNLGAGKTHFAKGFVAAIDPEARATSPTFSIVNEHRGGKFPVFHFDFHRLKSAEDLIALGWDEYLDETGILLCEWADMFPELMPANTKWLEIVHLNAGNRLVRSLDDPADAGQPC